MSDIRVGVDGRALANINRLRGIGRYTARLLESLSELPGLQLVVFSPRPPTESDLLDPRTARSLEWRKVPSLEGFSYPGMAAEHLLFARTVSRAGLDIFHGIDHNLSPFLPRPYLATVHDLILLVLRGPYLGPTAWAWMQFHRAAAVRSSMVVAVSENTRRDVARLWGIPERRIEVVPEGVPPEYAPVEDEAEIRRVRGKYGLEGPFFLYLGGFDPRKNLHCLLLGFKRFCLRGSRPHRMVLAGDTTGFREYLDDLVAELGLGERVTFTGFVEEGDLPALYSAAEALVCVSLYEGFGLPLLEAMSCGTPVVASRTSSLPEVVGEAGIMVDPLDPGEIAEGLTRVVEDTDTARELAEKGRERARSFSWRKTAEMVAGLYRRVLEGGGGH